MQASIIDISVLVFNFTYTLFPSEINISIRRIDRNAKPYCRSCRSSNSLQRNSFEKLPFSSKPRKASMMSSYVCNDGTGIGVDFRYRFIC
jgi:hypothetical protein